MEKLVQMLHEPFLAVLETLINRIDDENEGAYSLMSSQSVEQPPQSADIRGKLVLLLHDALHNFQQFPTCRHNLVDEAPEHSRDIGMVADRAIEIVAANNGGRYCAVRQSLVNEG